VLERHIFQIEQRRDRGVRTRALAEAQRAFLLQLKIAALADVAAFDEAENMLGVDLARPVARLGVIVAARTVGTGPGWRGVLAASIRALGNWSTRRKVVSSW